MSDHTEQSKALADVAAERARQIAVEGWTPEHDDAHVYGEIAQAAAAYAANSVRTDQPVAHPEGAPPIMWPWDVRWWKPRGRRRDLARAGALIIAEIERLDRKDPQP